MKTSGSDILQEQWLDNPCSYSQKHLINNMQSSSGVKNKSIQTPGNPGFTGTENFILSS